MTIYIFCRLSSCMFRSDVVELDVGELEEICEAVTQDFCWVAVGRQGHCCHQSFWQYHWSRAGWWPAWQWNYSYRCSFLVCYLSKSHVLSAYISINIFFLSLLTSLHDDNNFSVG